MTDMVALIASLKTDMAEIEGMTGTSVHEEAVGMLPEDLHGMTQEAIETGQLLTPVLPEGAAALLPSTVTESECVCVCVTMLVFSMSMELLGLNCMVCALVLIPTRVNGGCEDNRINACYSTI